MTIFIHNYIKYHHSKTLLVRPANGVVSEKVYFKNLLSKATQPSMKLRIIRIGIGRGHTAGRFNNER